MEPNNGLSSSKRLPADTAQPQAVDGPLVFVLVGPGGAGKGTVARRLAGGPLGLWLSRSWTTRAKRPGEDDETYVYVSREEFLRHAARDGFLEWAEFLGNLYGTPRSHPPHGQDLLLEIDVSGAHQVVGRVPTAEVILLLPPSKEVQRQRLVARGDAEEHVLRRLEKSDEEVRLGRELAGENVVVNDHLYRAVAEVEGIVQRTRAARRARAGPPGRRDHPEET